MADADLVARFIGAAALVVSAASATVSVLSYRRGGHRVGAGLGISVTNAEDGMPVVHWIVSIVNAGQGSVQVTGFAFQFDRSAERHDVPSSSYIDRQLPVKLEGLHTIQWRIHREDAKSLIDQLGWQPNQVRGIVKLGSGKEIKTAAMNVEQLLAVVDHPPQFRPGERIHVHAPGGSCVDGGVDEAVNRTEREADDVGR
jgi:hypothetical protein